MTELLKQHITAGERFEGLPFFVLQLGDNPISPQLNIKAVAFQLLGADQKPLPFTLSTVCMAPTTGEMGNFEVTWQDGGPTGVFYHVPDNGAKRAYMGGLVVDGPRPVALRLRLTQAGGDDCPVLLVDYDGDLVREVASGTDWHSWSIPSLSAPCKSDATSRNVR